MGHGWKRWGRILASLLAPAVAATAASGSVLVTEHPAGRLALVTDQMAYRPVAQGQIAGEPCSWDGFALTFPAAEIYGE